MAISDGVLLAEDAAAGYPCLGIRCFAMTNYKRLEIGYLPEGSLLYFPSIFFFRSPPI